MGERCRYCDRPLDPADAEHRRHWPFCCARCRMAELGRWFDGSYVISRPLDEVTDDASPTPPGGAEALCDAPPAEGVEEEPARRARKGTGPPRRPAPGAEGSPSKPPASHRVDPPAE